MAKRSEEAGRRLGIIQTTAALYSLLFVVFITYGYVVLLQGAAGNLAYALGLVLALIAWSLARFIGGDEGGIRKYLPLFILLLTISALGVFNTMLATFESKNILSEAVDSSYARYTQLAGSVRQAQDKAGITQRTAEINSGLQRLTAEIKNPMNCGQGPVAMAIIKQLGNDDLLPGFGPLSRGNSTGCGKAEQLITAYRDMADKLSAKASWNDLDLQEAAAAASSGQKALEATKSKVSSSPGAIHQVKSSLEALAPVYAGHVSQLYSRNLIKDVPATLDLRQADSIAEWSQVINLILGRWNKPSTYFYLLVAVFADWMMVYLFSLVRESKAAAPRQAAPGHIKSAW